MNQIRTAILHYSAPPIVGGVEAVMQAHARVFTQADFPVTIIAGRGAKHAFVQGVDFTQVSLMDSLNPLIQKANLSLEQGIVPANFEELTNQLINELRPILLPFDTIIVHNLFTKHFNLPLTAALYRLLDDGIISNCVAWCHDLSWTSPSSRSKVYPGYPWDLIRTFRSDVTYVTISEARKTEMLNLYSVDASQIDVVYNGVDPQTLLGLSKEGANLIQRLGLWNSDLNMLMPVRVTQAKNIEYAIYLAAAFKEMDVPSRIILTGPPDPHDERSMTYFKSLLDLRQRLGVENEFRFVYNSGPVPSEPYTLDEHLIGELYRASDILFMPSHREGFGMPILEAGLVGVPVVTTNIPAAVEVGGLDVLEFSTNTEPSFLASQIHSWIQDNPVFQLRARVRKNYTWHNLFERQIRSLLRAKKQVT